MTCHELKNIKLGDVAEIYSGFAFKSEDLKEGEIPVIRIANIQNKQVLKSCDAFFPKNKLSSRLNRYFLHQDDILIAMTGAGSVGKVGKMIGKDRDYLVNQRVGIVRIDKSKADPEYIYQVLSQNYYEDRLYQLGLGAGQPNVSAKDIGNLEIPFPQIHIQKKLASILLNYEKLSVNNSERLKLLESMAKLIYDEWFVKFKFPGHEKVKMVDSELGEIPEGWEVGTLHDIANIQVGYPFKSSQFCDDSSLKPIVRIRDILNNSTETFSDEEVNSKYEIHLGDMLIGMDGIFHVCKWSNKVAFLNQRVARLRPKNDVANYYLYLSVKPKIERLNEVIVGTTVQHLSQRDFDKMKMVIPPSKLMKLFKTTIDSLYDHEIKLKQKNLVLIATRDMLLPKLMSGELDVSELDIKVSEVEA